MLRDELEGHRNVMFGNIIIQYASAPVTPTDDQLRTWKHKQREMGGHTGAIKDFNLGLIWELKNCPVSRDLL